MSDTITYTITDEAPALATRSWLPIIKAFCSKAKLDIQIKDISLAARVLAQFPEAVTTESKYPDALSELGQLVKSEEANIIKLPNISASVPQLNAAIEELNKAGFEVPPYPSEARSSEEKDIQRKYSIVLGSAVNPVLREGNSDRRVAKAVKEYARKNPHSMGEWSKDSKTHVSHMHEGDFYSSEKSHVCEKGKDVRIDFVNSQGETTCLKKKIGLLPGEIIDAATMSCEELKKYFKQQIELSQKDGLLLSLHLKATMMKVSDPIIFSHALKVYFDDEFKKYSKLFESLGIEAKNGLANLFKILESSDNPQASEATTEFKAKLKQGPDLAMVDSVKGISNLHVPSDVIIDASMPAAIRSSGKMWGPDGKLHDTRMLIPDRSYAGIYQKTIEFCQEHGAFDPKTMGSVANVGLMAKKAEEYGSHDKTFEIKEKGTVKVVSSDDKVLFEHEVDTGDIWRMCQTKEVAVKDWVRLAIERARLSGTPAIFWLDPQRAHDANLIKLVEKSLPEHDTKDLDIQIMATTEAMEHTLTRCKEGQDTISVTGNVLRDYLTDLFPILELGTSAKMLSIVPLLAGGSLFETGAGGSAPKHVQQLVAENHLRWDSLGEFLALAVSLEFFAQKTQNKRAQMLADGLNFANSKYLEQNKSPSRKVKEIDNRGSQYFVAKYWSEYLSRQEGDAEMQTVFKTFHTKLEESEATILKDLIDNQGDGAEIGGYYLPDNAKATSIMRPSTVFNEILDSL